MAYVVLLGGRIMCTRIVRVLPWSFMGLVILCRPMLVCPKRSQKEASLSMNIISGDMPVTIP